MSSPLINQHVKAVLTCAARNGSGSTTTFEFTNRTQELQLGGNSRAILKSFSGVGMTVGQDGMPAEQTGSIVIKDAPESWGEERRFVDELAVWSPTEQPVAIYVAQEDLDANVAAFPPVSKLPSWSSFIGIYDLNGTTTIDSVNRISQITDASSAGNNATQSTDANKPVLTRSDNQENLYLQSEDLSTTWTKTRCNVTANAVADPITGGTTIDKLYDDVSLANSHLIFQTQDVIVNRTYRISAIAKTAGRDISIRFDNTGFTASSFAHFNLSTGAVTSVSGGASAQISPLGNGWYFIEAYATCIATSSAIAMAFYLASPAGTTTYSGGGASGVYLGRCQLQDVEADRTYVASTTYQQHRGINGQKAAFFDGVNDYFLANGLTSTVSGDDKAYTLFAVVKQNKLTATQTFFGLGNSATATPGQQIAADASINFNWRRGDSAAAVQINSAAPSTNTRILTLVLTGTAATFYIDNVAQYTLTAQDVPAMTVDRAAFGSFVRTTAADFFSGKMAWMGVYNGAMSATDLLAWQDYLSDRFLVAPATTAISYTKIFQGVCKNFVKSFDGESDELTLNISSGTFPPARLGYLVGDVITGVQTRTVTQNKGQALPFVFGTSVQTPAVQVVGGSTPVWAIASYFKSSSGVTLTYSGITSYIAKDTEGTYRTITNGSGSTYSFRSYATGANYPTPQGLTERAFITNKTGPGVYSASANILVNGRWRFRGQNNGGITPTGYIYFSLYEYEGYYITSAGAVSDTGRPGREVATATVDKADYLSDVRGATDFWVNFVWDKPVVMKTDGNAPYVPAYMISMRLSSYDTSTTDFVDGGNSGANTLTACTRTGRGEWSTPSAPVCPPWELYGLTFAEFSASEVSDRGCTAFGVDTTTTNTWSGLTNPQINIDLMVEMPGLKDDGSGTITGSAGSIIKYPHHVAKALTMEYSSNNFAVSSKYNSTTFATRNSALFSSSAPLVRQITGAFDGALDVSSMLAQIVSETACKLIQLNDGTLALWAWGYNQAAQATFTMENAKVTGLQSLDVSSVINRINVAYNKIIRNVSGALIPDGDPAFFNTTIEYASTLFGQSRTVYGRRELKDLQFNILADATTVANVAEYYVRSFDHPHWVATIDVPFWEFKALELMDTVNVCHPSLPSYYGTAANARLPTYSGAECTAVLGGDYNVRAQNYVGHVIGKTIDWQNDQMPSLKLEVWLVQPLHPNATI